MLAKRCWFAVAILTGCFALPGMVFAQGQQYALLVGIENYAHPRFRESMRLEFAVDDVVELGHVLEKSKFQVLSLDDDSGKRDPGLVPTKANIERHLQSTLRKCKEADTVILAFSGHGLQFAGQKDLYLCPRDARPFADEVATLVSMSKIYAELEKSFAGVKVILVDVCRNDPYTGRGRGLDADSLPPLKGVAALFSCSAGQVAYESVKLKRGIFFHYVLEGLRGEAANKRGEVTFNSLADYVSHEVPATVKALSDGREQSPNQISYLVGRTPVLARLSSAPQNPTIPVRSTPTPSGLIEGMRPSNLVNNAPARPKPTPSGLIEGKQAGETREDNGLKLKLAWCPAGSFTMGSPRGETNRDFFEAQVNVTFSRGFWLGRTEVTQGQWQQLMGTEPWKGEDYVQAGTDYPATCVSWEEAMEFCQKLTSEERKSGRLPAGWSYTLPTEAQWEYACRSYTKTAYSFGDDRSTIIDYGWYRENTWDIGEKYAQRVGLKFPNAWGLQDMHGNVWEWCRDWYKEKLPGGRDPEAAVEGTNNIGERERSETRVRRGGSWNLDAANCRSATRQSSAPKSRGSNLGFRLALSFVGVPGESGQGKKN